MGVATTIMRRPDPTKQSVELKTLSITAIEIPHSTKFAILLLLRIQRWAYM